MLHYFRKMRNALIPENLFGRLVGGFSEIPIKGLPQYPAIAQGFIDWFMLTIFSVSLLSQMLNSKSGGFEYV